MHVEEDLYSPKITLGNSPSVEILLHVFPSASGRIASTQAYAAAMEWLATHNVPSVTLFQRLTGVKVDPVSGSDGSAFDVTLSYSKYKTKTTIFSMDTGGETAKRYYGIVKDSAGKADLSNTAPDFQGGINFQNGEFQGIDVPVPGVSFSISTAFPWTFLTPEWVNILTLYRGCVNDSAFLFWATGEVMFVSANITQEEEITEKGKRRFFWRATFNFKVSPNITGLTNNNSLAAIDKSGWEAYWVYCASTPDPAAKRVIQRPIAHYSVEVASRVDFSALSIPDFRTQAQG